MSLEIEQREKEGITILDIKGRLTVGETASQLREKLKSMAASGVRSVVLNMKDVDYIDSTGLGTLVICYTTFQKAQGHLKLLNVSRRNIELLVLTKLETVFEVFADEQDAVNSFFPNREIRRFDILTFIQQHKQE